MDENKTIWIQPYSAQTTPKYPYIAIFDSKLVFDMPHKDLLLHDIVRGYYQDIQGLPDSDSRQQAEVRRYSTILNFIFIDLLIKRTPLLFKY